MLTKLFSVWHPGGAANSTRSGSTTAPRSAPVAPLHQVVLPDRSAAVSLPSGWQILSRVSGGGTIVALGPNKELVQLNASYLAFDPYNRAVQQGRQLNQQYGGGRPDGKIYYPYGANLAKTFVDIHHLSSRQQNLPLTSFNITRVDAVPSSPPQRCVHLSGTATPDQAGGQGVLDVFYCATPPNSSGSWMSSAFITNVPARVADQEHATLSAIEQSFQEDMNVVNREAGEIAAPVIRAIHAYGDSVMKQNAETNALYDRQNRDWEHRQDDQDKRNQNFSNYLLDQTVIQDNDNNAHGTVWNSTADALIHSNPNRFEYVDTPNFWKGIDY
jgi:hypothetical protein